MYRFRKMFEKLDRTDVLLKELKVNFYICTLHITFNFAIFRSDFICYRSRICFEIFVNVIS